jgi:hypothetical protein
LAAIRAVTTLLSPAASAVRRSRTWMPTDRPDVATAERRRLYGLRTRPLMGREVGTAPLSRREGKSRSAGAPVSEAAGGVVRRFGEKLLPAEAAETQPFLGLNYIIALAGIFPSRS